MRGAQADIIFIDEWGFFPQNSALLNALMPIFRLSHVALIGISSLDIENTGMFANVLKNGNDPDNCLVEVIDIQHICKACLEKGVKEVCPHSNSPTWISGKRDPIINMFIGEEDADVTFYREAMGVRPMETVDKKCFNAAAIDVLFDSPHVVNTRYPRFIFTAIDPAAGSDSIGDFNQSDLAIVSMTNEKIVIGIDAVNVVKKGSVEVDRTIINHIKGLRNIHLCEGTPIIVAIEAGTGIEPDRIRVALEREGIPKLHFMTSFTHKEGVKMDKKNKLAMMEMTKQIIEQQNLYFHKFLVSENKLKVMNALKQQLKNYEHVVKERVLDNGVKTKKYTLSGKLTTSTKDDISVCLQWAIFCQANFWLKSEFKAVRIRL